MPLLISKKTLALIVLLLAALALVLGYRLSPERKRAFTRYLEESAGGGQKSKEYLICEQFVKTKLTGEDGRIFTNYLPNPSGELTRGHDVLSESMGIMLGICAQNDDPQGFSRAWAFVKDKLIGRKGLVAWRLKDGVSAGSNAAVDDLRIAGALYSGAARFGVSEYRRAGARISRALLKYGVKNGLPASHVDFKGGAAVKTHLSYLDLASMRKLTAYSGRWRKVYNNSLALIEGGRAGAFPLFWDEYDRSSREYKKTAQLDLLTSMITFNNLCQAGEHRAEDIEWLKSELKKGGLYLKYSPAGEPRSGGESTAAYALVMLAARAAGDDELYDLAKERMLRLQVTDKESEIYGAFGNSKTLEVYSFDNLLALWALSLE